MILFKKLNFLLKLKINKCIFKIKNMDVIIIGPGPGDVNVSSTAVNAAAENTSHACETNAPSTDTAAGTFDDSITVEVMQSALLTSNSR